MRLRSVAAVAAALALAACGSSTPPSATPSPARTSDGSNGRLIRPGETVHETISATDPTWGLHGGFDLYRFEADDNERFTIELTSDEMDTYLVVGNMSGGLFDPIAEDDDSGGDLDAMIRFTAPEAGTYWILAQAYSEEATGAYTLSFQAMPAPRPAVASALQLGEMEEGSLDYEDAIDDEELKSYDLYTFAAEAGRRYSIAMSSYDFDAYLVLGEDDDGFHEITRNDDHGAGTDARIVFTPDHSGTYAVRASTFNAGEAGSYTIQVRELEPGTSEVVPLTFGETVAGELLETDMVSDDGSYYDEYSFRGTQGQRISITMASEELDSYLELAEPGDEWWSEHSDDDSGGNLDARLVVTLWRTGEYRVRANSLYPDEVGSYTITIDELGEVELDVRPIEVDETVTGSLEPTDAMLEDDSHYDIYTFRANAGERYRITLRSNDFDPYLSFGPWRDGDVDVTDNDDDSGAGLSEVDAQLFVTIPTSGTYAIRANSFNAGETGSYTLSLEEE